VSSEKRSILAVSLWLSWQDEVTLSSSDGEAVVSGPGARVALRPISPEIVAAMECLAPPGQTEEQIEETILASGSVDSLARWYYHVNQLRRRGFVRRSLYSNGVRLATLAPFGGTLGGASQSLPPGVAIAATQGRPLSPARKPPHRPADIFRLSRFAYLRREGAQLVVESPLCPARIILDDPRSAAVIAALASPGTISQVIALTPGLDVAEVTGLVSLFREAGIVDRGTIHPQESQTRGEPGAASGVPFAVNPALETWEFHDLLFHSRSRLGRSDGQFGGTYRMPHRAPPPAFKPEVAAEWFDLERPDAAQLERDDPPFALVQERRRSIREYGSRPLTARHLGEFLYRVARTTRRWQSEVHAPVGPIEMEFSARPYPAGGGLHELEFYLVVNACQDLPNGLYHYDPQQHRLGRLSGPNRLTELLLVEAGASAGIPWEKLQIHIILAARFERLAWKYESIAYALLLKDVGVVYQTMYLAATAMNLAPCGLGCGDSDLFARAAGLDYYVESSVGEFLLGSKQ